MNIFHPSGYQERKESVPPFQMRITSYKFQDSYYCSVDDVNPGAVISRSNGKTREEAEKKAIASARTRLEHSVDRMKHEI